MIGDLISNRYRIEGRLGSGGMSTVYLAEDETLQRQVAVKILHREISDQPDQIERFRREARAVAGLNHPNVVTVIDAGDGEGHPYIVFEYVPGETLKRRIDRLGLLPLDEAAAYAIEIGRGLAAAHARRLVHRDVKPQNVLIDADGRAKITDFGIARELEQDGLTATGRVLGTTDYVAPEQAMGHMVDERSDLYSLGIVLFEMLTGDIPFKAETQVGVAMKHVNEPMPDVQALRPEVSSSLAAIVDRATAKEPDDRYFSIEEMLAELERALEVEVARAGSPSSGEATTVIDSIPAKRRQLITGRGVSWGAIVMLFAAAASAIVIAQHASEDVGSRQQSEVSGGDPIEVQSAHDFDPLGDEIPPSENPHTVDEAIDGDATTTAWSTSFYLDAQFASATKTGVGIYVEVAAKSDPVRSVEIRTQEGGWSADVYVASDSPPDTLDGWTKVGSIPQSDGKDAVEFPNPVQADYVLFWFTKLALAQDPPEGCCHVGVLDLALFD